MHSEKCKEVFSNVFASKKKHKKVGKTSDF